MDQSKENTFVLASASISRRSMFQKMDISCICAAADIDETKIKTQMILQGSDPIDISEALALQKARVIAKKYPGKIILGSDQLLVCDNKIFDKPHDMKEARKHLRFFCGKTHYLHTSYVMLRDTEILVQETVSPQLTMRDFSDEFLQDYLHKSGKKILSSVGCYLMEERGPELFSEIKGDYFAILGLPLINVLENLRKLNVINK